MVKVLQILFLIVPALATASEAVLPSSIAEDIQEMVLNMNERGQFYSDNTIGYRAIDINRDGILDYLVAPQGKGFDEYATRGDRDWLIYLSNAEGGYRASGAILIDDTVTFREMPDMPGVYGFVGVSHVSSVEATVYAKYYVQDEGWQSTVYGTIKTDPDAVWNPEVPRELFEGPSENFKAGGEARPEEFLTPEQYERLAERPYKFWDRYGFRRPRDRQSKEFFSGQRLLYLKEGDAGVVVAYAYGDKPARLEYISCDAYEEDKRIGIIPEKTEIKLLCEKDVDDTADNADERIKSVSPSSNPSQGNFQPLETVAEDALQSRFMLFVAGIGALFLVVAFGVWLGRKRKGASR